MACNDPYPPDIPIDAECIEGSDDPCAPAVPTVCHTAVCDDKYADLPTSTRIKLIGIVGRCIYRFAHKAAGFVVSDEQGQMITNRPCVKIPFLKSFLKHPTTGEFIPDQNGDPLEGPVPQHDAIIVADSCGCQNRVQGTKDRAQHQVWNGRQFEFIDWVERGDNPLLDPEDVPIVDSTTCPAPLIATLVPTTKEVVGACGGVEIERGYTLGGLQNVGSPVGVMEIWAGRHDNVPAGYLLCDGVQYDSSSYPELFQAIGYGFGGNGGNLFNVPDVRGRFMRGVDQGVGNDPDADSRLASASGGNTGDAVGTLQEDQLQCFEATYDKSFSQAIAIRQGTHGYINVRAHANTYTPTDIQFTEGDCGVPRFGSETRPTNINVHYIIKAGCPPA